MSDGRHLPWCSQSQMPCDKGPQGGILCNQGARDSAATWHKRVKRPVEKRGEADLAEGTAYAKIMRHRRLGNG